jgi:hypothetical protein
MADELETSKSQEEHQQEICQEIDLVAGDMKKKLQSDTLFQQAIEKFTTTYKKLSKRSTNAHLITAFHKFGRCFGGTISCKTGGRLRRGRRIPIQAKSAGRR